MIAGKIDYILINKYRNAVRRAWGGNMDGEEIRNNNDSTQ